MDKNNITIFKFVDLDFIDYEYNIEEVFIDINNFKIEPPQANQDNTAKKDKKDQKGKDKKKEKSKGGSNISKQSSGLSTLSNKKKFISNAVNNKKVMEQIQNNKKIQQQIKNAQKGYKSAGKKIENQIKQIIATTKKIEKEKQQEIIKEETVFTGEKNINEEKEEQKIIEEEEKEIKKNPKKQKKGKKQPNLPLTETKAPIIESKQIDDFISQLKSQKTQKEIESSKKVELISIRNYIKQFRTILSEDATKKLKVKESLILEDEFLDSFIDKLREILDYCFENYEKNIEFLKQNFKEAIVLTDNLTENLINTNKVNYNLLDKLTTLFFILNKKANNEILTVREIDVFLLNIIYLYAKYPIFLQENNSITTAVNELNSYINEQYEVLLKQEEFKVSNDKFEIMYLMKLILNILFSKSNNINIKSLVIDNPSKLLIKRLENLDIISNYANLINDPENSHNIVKVFVNSLEELKILTKLTYILDKHKTNIFTLGIITTKNIESKLIEIQKIFLGENKQKYILLIYNLVSIFLKNYSHFQYIESSFEEKSLSNITDDVVHLIKMILDEKLFEDKLFSETLIINVEKFDLLEFPYEKEENSKIYVKFLMDFFKIYERFVNIFYIDNNLKNKAMDCYIQFFHSIMIIILNLRNNTYKEKYISSIKECIIKQFSNNYMQDKIIEYLISFVDKNVIHLKDVNNIMKNIKILKEFTKFYNCNEVKLNYISILEKLKKDNKDLEVNINILLFLKLVDKEEELQNLEKYLLNREDLFKKFLYFDKKICNFWLRNTYTNENEILKKINTRLLTNSISSKDFFEYFFKMFEENAEINKDQTNINIYKFVRFCNKLVKLNKDQIYTSYLTQFEQISVQLNKIRKLNLNNVVQDTLEIFLLNKLNVLYLTNKDQFKNRLFKSIESLEMNLDKTPINLKQELKKLNSIENYNFDLNFTFKSQNEILPYFLQIFQTCKLIESDTSVNCFKENLPKSENNENQIVEPQIIKYNLDIILKYFVLYLLFTIKNLNSDNSLLFLNNFLVVQETINEILNSDIIFKSFTQNSKLLTLFVKEYSHLILDMNRIFEECQRKINQQINILDNYQEINKMIITQSIIKSITNNFSDFINNRCANQLVKIFSENELYRLTLIKDRRLLNLLFTILNKEYTKTILEEGKVPELLKKLQQAEENDEEMDQIAQLIFSKDIIQFLEFPSEIIDYLSHMHEGMKLDIKDQAQHNYLNPTIFSYFYVWKIIMSKIENGFKLYTTDKKFVKNIDDYKTILRMLVSYFERNSKIYELFLLISMTLVHIDEDYVDQFLSGSNEVLEKIDKYDETQFSNIYDENTFYFILYVLYKFVKIFPSHVKYWFEKAHKKLHNTFNKLVKNIIKQKILIEIKDKLTQFKSSIVKSGIILKEFKSQNFIDLRLNLNDEIYFEISVEFPNIFPLKKVNLKLTSNAYLEEMKVMTVKMSLNNVFNASIDNISDNLVLWSENVKQILLTGMDCCPICYYYIQQTDKSLPKSTCRTCKKKFHSLCMKEWFRSAEKKTCPLCRSEWH